MIKETQTTETMTAKIKTTRTEEGYFIKTTNYNWKIYRLDDQKSFGYTQYDKAGNFIFDDGYYNLRLKDIKSMIVLEEKEDFPSPYHQTKN